MSRRMAVDDKRAPMASAPMRYLADGAVDWGAMWDSFCALACEGGPPHRGTMLNPQEDAEVESPGYRSAAAEIARGIPATTGLAVSPDRPGWLAVACPSPAMARWFAEVIVQGNVQARWEDARLFVPCGAGYTLKEEIKNVITVVAKAAHYWRDHGVAEAPTGRL